MSIFLGIYKNNIYMVQLFYWLPHFPMTVLLAKNVGQSTGDNLSQVFAYICLFLSIPAYYFLYMYLDQVIPNTYGISKSMYFCLKRTQRGSRSGAEHRNMMHELDEDTSALDEEAKFEEKVRLRTPLLSVTKCE